MSSILPNPQDTLLTHSSDAQRQLLQRLVAQCAGASTDVVLGAALNLFVNAIRQAYPNRLHAERRYSELTGQGKELLLNFYDSVTGKRRSTFAHTQFVNATHIDDRDKVKH